MSRTRYISAVLTLKLERRRAEGEKGREDRGTREQRGGVGGRRAGKEAGNGREGQGRESADS